MIWREGRICRVLSPVVHSYTGQHSSDGSEVSNVVYHACCMTVDR